MSDLGSDPDLKSGPTDQPFGAEFWCAYVANTSLMVAVSALFRYADFVTSLGGSEYELGWIIGVGMLGALAMRVFQGVGIDRYGAGRIWTVSLLLVMVSLLAAPGDPRRARHLDLLGAHALHDQLSRRRLGHPSRSSPCVRRGIGRRK